MINKYPTIYEIQEVLNSPLITRGFINQFAQKRGIFLVNASKEDLIKELSYHLYEYTDLDEIRNLAYQSSNKQVLSGFTIISKEKNFDLENLYDRLRDFGQLQSKGYQLKAITKKKIGENVIFHGEIEYTKRKTGKIEFLQNEKLATDFYFHSIEDGNWQVEVDGNTSSDGKEVMKLMNFIVDGKNAEINSLEIDNLTIPNVISFFDRLTKEGLDNKTWRISDIKQLTFKRRKSTLATTGNDSEEDDESDEDIAIVDDENLGGISQAVLDGRNLREHPFVKQAEKDGCIFTAMTYESENIKKPQYISIKAEFKGSPKIFEVSIISTARVENTKRKKVYYTPTIEYKREMSSLFWNNAKRIYQELI